MNYVCPAHESSVTEYLSRRRKHSTENLQLVVPIALLFALRALGINESLVVVFTIMFAMPIGALAPSFAEQFGHDSMLAAKGTVLSTAAAFAIIPLVVAVMAMP